LHVRGWLSLVAGLALIACQEKEVEHEGKPIAYWVQQMTNPDSNVRHQAVAAFAHDAGRSPEAARALLEVLSDEREADVHATIANALGTLGSYALEAAPALVRLLDDEHETVRQSAASALGALGTRSPLVVPALVHALDDKDHDVRAAAAEGLARAGPAAASGAAPLLRIASTDRIGWVRLQAVIALGRIRASPEAVLPLLTDIATKEDWPTLRAAAVDALTSYASSDRLASRAIAAAARDTSREVRDAALRARRALSDSRRDSSTNR
jgi:HEAT repeat protein